MRGGIKLIAGKTRDSKIHPKNKIWLDKACNVLKAKLQTYKYRRETDTQEKKGALLK